MAGTTGLEPATSAVTGQRLCDSKVFLEFLSVYNSRMVIDDS